MKAMTPRRLVLPPLSPLAPPRGPLRGPVGPLPGAVYDPPPSPIDAAQSPSLQQVIFQQSATEQPYEATIVSVPFAPGITGGPQSVYSTKQAWKAIDVFVDMRGYAPVTPGPSWVTVCIYGIVQGVRFLAATGRTRSNGATSTPIHIATARRVIAERWEVVIGTIFATLGAGGPKSVLVSVIATDDPVPYADDSSVGVMDLRAGATSGMVTTQNVIFPTAGDLENYSVVGVAAVALVAGPRFLMLFPTPPAGGARPLLTWGLPAIGATVFGTESKIFGALGRLSSPTFGISTTGDVFAGAAIGDAALMGWVR